MTSPRWRIINT